MPARYADPVECANPHERLLSDSPALIVALEELSRILSYSAHGPHIVK